MTAIKGRLDALLDEGLRAKAERFVTRRRGFADMDRLAGRELEESDADAAQGCSVQAYFHDDAAALVEELLAAAQAPLATSGRIERVMVQAQVFASAWAMVGGRFDTGDALGQAEAARQQLRALLEGGE